MAESDLPRSHSTRKQTVVVVHGTQFDKEPPTAGGEIAWWRPGSAFAETLDAELAKRGTTARCWAHLADGEPGFEWDGRNDWHSRAEAADRLRSTVRGLQAQGWLVHLVGHSHGGNVIFQALANTNKEIADWYRGRICLLGTPVFNRSSSYHALQRRLFWAGILLGLALLALLSWFFDLHQARPIREMLHHDYIGLVVIAPLCVVLFKVLEMARGRIYVDPGVRTLRYGSFVRTGTCRTPQIMLIGSESDEAYKLLSGLKEPSRSEPSTETARGASAPEKTGTSLWAIARTAHRSAADRFLSPIRRWDPLALLAVGAVAGGALILGDYWDRSVAEALGAEIGSSEALLWLAVILALLGYALTFGRQLMRIVALPFLAACYLAGTAWNAAWGLLSHLIRGPLVRIIKGFVRQLGYGFLGGPVAVRHVEVGLRPDSESDNWFYLELPPETVERVRKAQTPKLSALVDALYAEPTSDDAFVALTALAPKLDLPLVHSVYHGDADCLACAARWLSTGEAKDIAYSRATEVTETRPSGESIPGHMVSYPYADFWESTLLGIFEPEKGWGCRLPEGLTSELHWADYWNATTERGRRLYELYQAIYGQGLAPGLASPRPAEVKRPGPFSIPPKAPPRRGGP